MAAERGVGPARDVHEVAAGAEEPKGHAALARESESEVTGGRKRGILRSVMFTRFL
jgi:hypothetical protein